LAVHEGKICQTILEMYNKDAIVAEPRQCMASTITELKTLDSQVQALH